MRAAPRAPTAAAVLRPAASALALTALLLAACGPSAPPRPDPSPRYIVTVGEGEVSATPDRAELRVGVDTEAETAAEALRLNAEAMTAVLDRAEALGLDRRADVRTLQVSVRPRYERVAPRVGAPRRRTLVSYEARNEAVVTVRDLARLSEILDATTEAGATRTDGVRFFLADQRALADDARRQAFADAQRKAALLAGEAEAALGEVLAIDEPGAERPENPRPRVARVEMGAAIAPGETSVRARLIVRWALVAP